MCADQVPYRPQALFKRDGQEVPFEAAKIERAIAAAGQATGEFAAHEASALADAVLARLLEFHCVGVEQVQDRVERVLMEAGYYQTARAYIVYRERHGRLRRERKQLIDVAASMNEYLSRQDWRVQANANQGYSLGGLILNVSGKVTANYWLDEVYSEDIGRAHREADLHIHDLDMLAGYCAGWSLRTLLHEGLNGIPGRVEAGPPKHLSSALGQMVNFLGTLQNEWAGAQAFSSFDTYLAPYVRKDNLSYAQVRQSLQEFIYNLNVPSRWGTQTPFTNLTFDWVCPEDLREQVPVIGGQEMPFCYGELQAEMELINRAYIEVMMAGDAKGRVFTFPIPTYNITHDFPWDSDNATRLFDMTARYGLPYFQNFLNSDMLPNHVRSMCCRLQLDLRELLKRGNGLFGSAEQTGSIGVVTVNLPRLALKSKNEKEFIKGLAELMDMARDTLETKRKVIEKLTDANLYPYTKFYLRDIHKRFNEYWKNHFSTIGLIGMNEAALNLLGVDIGSKEGKEFGERVLDFMRDRLLEYQEETGNNYNLEATPAEGTTYRLAQIDRADFPEKAHFANGIGAKTERPFYTNSTHLPVNYTDDLFELLDLQDNLQTKYTGGTVIHFFLGERADDAEALKKLVKTICQNYRLPYFTFSPSFSVCPVDGYLAGEHPECIKCGKTTEIYSRVVGFLRPVSHWNDGKQAEFEMREHYDKAIGAEQFAAPAAV